MTLNSIHDDTFINTAQALAEQYIRLLTMTYWTTNNLQRQRAISSIEKLASKGFMSRSVDPRGAKRAVSQSGNTDEKPVLSWRELGGKAEENAALPHRQ